jgi:hypothetical protein
MKEFKGLEPGKYNWMDTSIVRMRPPKSNFGMDCMIAAYTQSKENSIFGEALKNTKVTFTEDYTMKELEVLVQKHRQQAESVTLIVDHKEQTVSDDAYSAFIESMKKIAKDMEEEKREGNSNLQSRPEIEGS